MSNQKARQSITALSWSEPFRPAPRPSARFLPSRPIGGGWRGVRLPLATSAAIHVAILILLLLRIVPLWPMGKAPMPPPAKVELVVQDTPTVGDGPREQAAAAVAKDASQAAPPAAPLPPLPEAERRDQVAVPKAAPTPPAEAKPAAAPTPPHRPTPPVRLGLGGDPGTGLVSGADVIPAGPDSTVHNIPPAYPEAAAMLHEQGRVLLLVHVAPDGSAAAVDVMESSGYLLLDRAARDAVAKWRFRPAMADGAPVESQMPIEINFDLQAKRVR